MTTQRIFALFILIGSIILFIFGSSISSKVAQGEMKVANAEQNADQGRRGIGPVRRGMKEQASKNAHEKIGEEKQTIAKYQVTANWLHGTGTVLFIVGAVMLVCSFCPKKRS